ncbi:uncharacterized protein [Asterias amurensis]|uniref:uncharacterized protein n=1 Tax=Asterias amurensis TaxID=7602 RepID=UPI003AB4001F
MMVGCPSHSAEECQSNNSQSGQESITAHIQRSINADRVSDLQNDGWLPIALSRGVSIKQLTEWPGNYHSSHPKINEHRQNYRSLITMAGCLSHSAEMYQSINVKALQSGQQSAI